MSKQTFFNEPDPEGEIQRIAINEPFDQDRHDKSVVIQELKEEAPDNVVPIMSAPSLRKRDVHTTHVEAEYIEPDPAGPIERPEEIKQGKVGKAVMRLLFGPEPDSVGQQDSATVRAAKRRQTIEKHTNKLTR